jgi:hypothetical protein
VKVNYGGLLADPIPGDLQAGAYATFLDNGTYYVLLNAQAQGRYPPGYLNGLTLTTDVADATNDIDIAVGSARDATDVANMDWTSAYVKQADTAWAVGSAAGSLDTGAVGNSQYYIWGIKRPDTGVTDYLTSLSSTAPTMPANYTIKRLLGTFTRTGGVNGTPTIINLPGEYVDSTVLVGSAVALTTNTAANVTSISLTAGDWDVSGVVLYVRNAATSVTRSYAWVSSTSATQPTPPAGGFVGYTQTALTGTTDQSLAVGTVRFRLSATTTIYLSTITLFTVNTNTAYGILKARRVG